MKQKLFSVLFLTLILIVGSMSIFGQDAQPTPTPQKQRTVKRTSGVSLSDPAPKPSPTPLPSPNVSPSPSPTPSSSPTPALQPAQKDNKEKDANHSITNEPLYVVTKIKLQHINLSDEKTLRDFQKSINAILSENNDAKSSLSISPKFDEITLFTTESKLDEISEFLRNLEAAEKERLEKAQREKDELLAAKAALARERQMAADEAARIEREKAEAEKAALLKKAEDDLRVAKEEAERKARETEEAKAKALADAEQEKQRIAAEAEKERQRLVAEAEKEKQRIADEAAAEQKRLAEQAEQERQRFEQEKAEKERLANLEAEKARQEVAKRQQVEDERTALAKSLAEEKERNEVARQAALENERKLAAKREEERLEKERLRSELIEAKARELRFVDVSKAKSFVSADVYDTSGIEAALKEAVVKHPELITVPKPITFCDSAFVGESLDFDFPGQVTLGDLLNTIRYKKNVNFLPDAEVMDLPVQGNVTNLPWNVILRTSLDFNDLAAECGDGYIKIVKRIKLVSIQDNRKKSAPLVTDLIKLKYLSPNSGNVVNVAGKSSGNAGDAFESLEVAINKILRVDGDNRGSVTRIPLRNELLITATEDQLKQIKAVIARADRPAYQVYVKAYVYTGDMTKIKDIGFQGGAIFGTGDLSQLGGFTSLSNGNGTSGSGGNSSGSGSGSGSSTGSGTTTTTQPGDIVPGGVRTLGQGFGTPANGNGILGVSATFGTNQFFAQLTALEQKGIAKVESYPFIVVKDGGVGTLDMGRQIPIIVQGGATGNGGVTTGQLEVLNAGNSLQITPQVAEDENGNPTYISLNLRIESNDVDASVITQGVQSIIRRSVQTQYTLRDGETVIFRGFSANSDSNTTQRVPIPILGSLFKRKVKQQTDNKVFFALAVRVVRQDQVIETVQPPPNATLPSVTPTKKP